MDTTTVVVSAKKYFTIVDIRLFYLRGLPHNSPLKVQESDGAWMVPPSQRKTEPVANKVVVSITRDRSTEEVSINPCYLVPWDLAPKSDVLVVSNAFIRKTGKLLCMEHGFGFVELHAQVRGSAPSEVPFEAEKLVPILDAQPPQRTPPSALNSSSTANGEDDTPKKGQKVKEVAFGPKEADYVTKAQWIPRGIALFDNIGEVMRLDMHMYLCAEHNIPLKLEMDDQAIARIKKVFCAILTHLPKLESMLEHDYNREKMTRIIATIKEGAHQSWGDDVAGLKKAIRDLVPLDPSKPLLPPLQPGDSKSDRGFNHKVLAHLLLPVSYLAQYEKDQAGTIGRLKSGELPYTGPMLLVMFYKGYKYNPDDPEEGLFQSELIVRGPVVSTLGNLRSGYFALRSDWVELGSEGCDPRLPLSADASLSQETLVPTGFGFGFPRMFWIKKLPFPGAPISFRVCVAFRDSPSLSGGPEAFQDLQCLRHILLGPSQALVPDGAATKGKRQGNAAIHQIWKITRVLVGYAVVQLHFAMYNHKTWAPRVNRYLNKFKGGQVEEDAQEAGSPLHVQQEDEEHVTFVDEAPYNNDLYEDDNDGEQGGLPDLSELTPTLGLSSTHKEVPSNQGSSMRVQEVKAKAKESVIQGELSESEEEAQPKPPKRKVGVREGLEESGMRKHPRCCR
ncbi:hypothetical protein BC834DRAFT_847690 [Gloeopeniophorella convolvens]|nr:hypothetical protein BC834DRAFT_847690 [Gloeopeniophorella convolvens]